MMVLPDHEIVKLGEEGAINPFDPNNVQPASLDILLGNTFRVFLAHRTDIVDLADPSTWQHLSEHKLIKPGQSFTLHPQQFALGRSLESFKIPDDMVARLEGKSSLARLAQAIHVTGGFIDPGFEGTITLELVNLLPVPVRMWPGRKIGQVCFMHMSSAAEHPYATHPDRANRYQGQVAATASRHSS